jgi:hypothetical protein
VLCVVSLVDDVNVLGLLVMKSREREREREERLLVTGSGAS